jgi:hypothetical protein
MIFLQRDSLPSITLLTNSFETRVSIIILVMASQVDIVTVKRGISSNIHLGSVAP